ALKIREVFVKSLPTSLFQREELPLFGKEGTGEIFRRLCLFNYGLLSKSIERINISVGDHGE
ncbi:MAG: hypothetical protein ACXU9X_14555, partial [Thermodesulfobacteriota bacterium]